ncbi:MAG TPA: hypothetical protein VIP48_00630 [Streptosporangiaceae bacterium]
MPVARANGTDIYYEVQGEGEPLVMIPYLAAEVTVFEDCAHAPIYQNVEEFNQRTLEFLRRQAAVT